VKLAKVLARYFYQAQVMNINGLGTFKAAGYVEENAGTQNIDFTFNKQVPNDDALIQFIIDETGKMRPLAISDLESFVASGQQLLNIGKPFFIEGLGAVQKNKQGAIEFVPGEMVSEKASLDIVEERKLRMELTEKPQQKIIDRVQEGETTAKPKVNWLRIGLSLLGLTAVLAGGYFAYKYLVLPSANSKPEVTKKDSTNGPQNLNMDTLNKPKDSTQTNNNVTAKPTLIIGADGKLSYNIVFKTVANKAEADAYLAKDLTYKDIKFQAAAATNGSYKIFIPFVSLPTDTSANLKSVISYFKSDSTKVFIDK
jgi:hypothetical protein